MKSKFKFKKAKEEYEERKCDAIRFVLEIANGVVYDPEDIYSKASKLSYAITDAEDKIKRIAKE